MKLIELVNARYALQKLVAQDLPIRLAYRLMTLTESCNRYLNFYGQEVDKLGEDPDPQRLKELQDFEITDLNETKLRLPVMDGLMLSASDVKALEPLIEFFEEEQ